jgi:hypothetical protein
MRCAVAVLTGLLCLVVGLSAEETAGGLDDEWVLVTIEGLGTPLSGPTLAIGSSASALVPGGQSFRFLLGYLGDKDESCGIVAPAFGGNVDQYLQNNPLVYTADVKVLEAEMDRIKLAVDWKRHTKTPDASPRPLAGDRFEVTLKEGQRMVLDVIDRPNFLNPQCRNFMLQMTPSILEQAPFVERQITYELWFVHEAPDGKRVTSSWKATGRQGEKLHLQFPDEVLGKAAGDAADLRLRIEGDVRGRMRQGGGIDVGVDLSETILTTRKSQSRHQGVKRVHVQPGETIRIDIPESDQRAGQLGSPYLRGHKLGLVLTATPVP